MSKIMITIGFDSDIYLGLNQGVIQYSTDNTNDYLFLVVYIL
jgi:hypothetical protein